MSLGSDAGGHAQRAQSQTLSAARNTSTRLQVLLDEESRGKVTVCTRLCPFKKGLRKEDRLREGQEEARNSGVIFKNVKIGHRAEGSLFSMNSFLQF